MAYDASSDTDKSDLTFIRNSMAQPLLEREAEQILAQRWRYQRDEKALHQLITAYGRLVVAMAHKFKHYGLPLSDLIQEGNIGLMEAANRFEPERDLRFSTYASWWVRSCLQDYVLRNWSIVRTGTTSAHKSLFFNFRRLRAKILTMDEMAELDDAARQEIAEELGVKVSDVLSMEQRLNGGDHSLNMAVGDDGEHEYQDFLADDRPNPEQIVVNMRESQTRQQWLQNALNQLNDREQHIVRQRALADDTITLEALGKHLGVSKERVRQLEQRAMSKLRSSLLQQQAQHVSNDRPIMLKQAA